MAETLATLSPEYFDKRIVGYGDSELISDRVLTLYPYDYQDHIYLYR